ncbi:MAG: tetratricopeptide repeat protein [Xanthobacteraceae bacterium]|jgi:serine/threonine-protein kinase PknG
MNAVDLVCQRPGCSGKIVDGVCEDCGRPPVGHSLLADGPSGTGTVGTAATRGTVSRRGTRQTRGTVTTRSRLGGGLVSLPPLPSTDPLKLIIDKPEVPASRRICPHCDKGVNRDEGFCPHCGNPYSFKASLKPGDVVAAQYEVRGPIAYGGMGWIYLGWDNVLNRFVVLKGLLNAKDEAAAAAAVAERQFLAAVKNPRIVGIHNFVTHGAEGFIVMEYVGGRTIKSLRKERGPLPVPEAIAYILGVLPALAYLHSQGIAYCDFKPDNVMLEEGDVKLIDMGGVRRIDSDQGPVFYTAGYAAPEVASGEVVPNEVTDLYTVGRTLAELIVDFRPYGAYEFALPGPAEQPVLAEHEALYRLLLRSTHRDPDQRFQTADEMADQLYGVLREAVAIKEGPKPAESKIFTADQLIDADDTAGTAAPLARLLPALKVDAGDPAANLILAAAAVNRPEKRLAALRDIATRKPDSVEAMLRLADALIPGEPGGVVPDETFRILARLEEKDPFDWRVHWYRGKALLAAGQGGKARSSFDRAYFEQPGELAPKLAIAFAAETEADARTAAVFYDRVSRVDPDHTSACFGLARIRAKAGDRDGIIAAVEALRRVPASSSLYSQAQIRLADLLIQDGIKFDHNLLEQAAETIEQIGVEGGIVHQLAGRLFVAAVELIENGTLHVSSGSTLLGSPLAVTDLRLAAERRYRSCARLAEDVAEKIRWVDLANRVRPVTLF